MQSATRKALNANHMAVQAKYAKLSDKLRNSGSCSSRSSGSDTDSVKHEKDDNIEADIKQSDLNEENKTA